MRTVEPKSADYEQGERSTARKRTDLVINLTLARHPPRVLNWKAANWSAEL